MLRRSQFLLVGLGLVLSIAAVAAPKAPNYHVVNTIAVGGEGGWDYVTVDSAAHRLYISRSTRVMVVDVKKGVLVGEVANTPGVHGIALDAKLHRGFTSNGGDNTVTVFDMKTLKEITRVKVGTRPDTIIFDPATSRVFTFNGGSQDSTVIDARSMAVVSTIPLGGRPEYAAADGKGLVFVNIEDKNENITLDAKTLAIKCHAPITPGDEPSGLAMDIAHRRLFAVCSNQQMVVLDADSGKVVATPAIGKGPDAAAFDPKSGLAFSSNGQDGTITVVKEETPATFTVVQTVKTQMSARTMALDPKTHLIYLPAARFLPLPPAETPPAGQPQPRRRPALEPNSFVILVVGP